MIFGINLPGYLSHLPEKRWQAIILFSIFVLQYLFEHFFPENRKYNNVKNEMQNVLVGIVNALVIFIPSALLVELISLIEKFKIGLFQLIVLPLWQNIILSIVVMDLFMYWWHRFNHTKKYLWYFHRFHHKDEKMNTTTALRFHSIELLLSAFFKGLFFILAGFSFLPIMVYEILFFTIVLIHHSNIRISSHYDFLYRLIFSSPMMHRIHHSNIQEETDSNYGSVFSWWDRLFGTYKKEAKGEIIFGIDKKIKPISII